jgi:hypothetical protein
MSTARRFLRTLARVGLTLFVFGQILFLVSSNLLGVEEPLRERFKKWYLKDDWHKDVPVPEFVQGKGEIHKTYFDKTRTYTKHWAQLTGQPQSWGLFAPDVGRLLPFPAVELRWDDEDWPDWAERPPLADPRPAPVVVLSDNEPRDPHRYVKFALFRVRKYEEQITPFATNEDSAFDPATNAWADKIQTKVRKESDCIYNFLRWRLQVYQRANPDLPPPTQVILLVRTFHIPEPPGPEPWDWSYLGEDRVARWLPAAPLDAKEYRYVERYDPVAGRFRRMARGE